MLAVDTWQFVQQQPPTQTAFSTHRLGEWLHANMPE